MENLFTLGSLAIAAIPLDLGLVSAFKSVGLPGKFAPLASIAIGVGLMFLSGEVAQAAIAQGIIVGLAASGLFSGSKALFGQPDTAQLG